MALHDLLVYVDQTENSLVRLRLAADLASRHGSRLTALYVREWSREQVDTRKAAELGLVSAADLAALNGRIEASVDGTAEQLRSALEALTHGRDIQAELQCVDGIAATVVPLYARYRDLCVLGRDEPEGPSSINYTFSEHLLFVSGRPVLFIPAVASLPTLGRHVVVAWNSSRPATRSLNDALPLIERAERTTVVMINPSATIEARGGPPGEQIVEHLRRHGATADAVRVEDVPVSSIAATLQEQAQRLGADLIVAGAFGYPRLWEKLLGGVTHDLLAGMSLPVFMSH